MLVSTDTELNWLSLFSNLSSPSHQLVGVPVFEDGGSCGLYGGGSPVRERWKTSNIDTTNSIFIPGARPCPNVSYGRCHQVVAIQQRDPMS